MQQQKQEFRLRINQTADDVPLLKKELKRFAKERKLEEIFGYEKDLNLTYKCHKNVTD